MDRFLEFLFGAQRGPAGQGVERALDYNPPLWMAGHARLINTVLVLAAIAVVFFIYRRDGRRPGARIGLGVLRLLVFFFVILLLNRPVIRETKVRVEPSVLPILVDDTISMTVRDVNPDGTPTDHSIAAARAAGPTTQPGDLGEVTPTRLNAVLRVLNQDDQALLRKLASVHTLHLYTFNKDRHELGASNGAPPAGQAPTTAPASLNPQLSAAVRNIKPDLNLGNTTQVIPSLLEVLDDLQGQRLAGIVVMTDARETPTGASQAMLDKLRQFPVKIYPVVVGSERAPQNIELSSVAMQDSVFKDDLVSAKITVRATGYEKNHAVKVAMRDKKTGQILLDGSGHPAEKTVTLPDANPLEVELVFKPDQVGTLEAEAVAEVQPGELDDKDNVRPVSLAVLDASINVLYVDGYPRWEYRYIKNEMIRDKTINISCLLTSASAGFNQEGDDPLPFLDSKQEMVTPENTRVRTRQILAENPQASHGSVFPGRITRFPETAEELMKYDVVLFGDVDSRQFTDRQLQLISDFVNKKGGGFGMIAGPRYSPIAYRNSALEAILPVNIANVLPEDPSAEYRDGWRPVITDEGHNGEASTIFRFIPGDPKANDKYLREDLQPLFWFCQGITVKPGVGLVYAEHPVVTDQTGRKAPILVLGRSGAGRTLFSAIDSSWRWRFYTGESIFDNYWVQQIRYLARGRKLGQRRMTFTASKPTFELGQRVNFELKVLDPVLLQQLPPQLRVDIADEQTGQAVAQVAVIRQESPPDVYIGSFNATGIGRFVARLPAVADNVPPTTTSFEVIVPRLELSNPEVDRTLLTKLAPPDQIIPLAKASTDLPLLIKSAARNIPVPSTFPLWDKWQALGIFVLLLTTEWVLRKVFGML